MGSSERPTLHAETRAAAFQEKADRMTIDPGRQIAIDYWQATPHVWSNGYPDNTHCALCASDQKDSHKEPTPKPTKPIVVLILDRVDNTVHSMRVGYPIPDGYTISLRGYDSRTSFAQSYSYADVRSASGEMARSYSFQMHLSCGHGPVGMACMPKNLPRAGDDYDCFTCERAWHDQNWPSLPEEVYAQIEATMPMCPECGEGIARIPFVLNADHNLFAQRDSQTGELDAQSDRHTTFAENPDWWPGTLTQEQDGWETGTLSVECSNHHAWQTDRLSYKRDGNDHTWRLT